MKELLKEQQRLIKASAVAKQRITDMTESFADMRSELKQIAQDAGDAVIASLVDGEDPDAINRIIQRKAYLEMVIPHEPAVIHRLQHDFNSALRPLRIVNERIEATNENKEWWNLMTKVRRLTDEGINRAGICRACDIDDYCLSKVYVDIEKSGTLSGRKHVVAS